MNTSTPSTLTPEESGKLQEYVDQLDELAAREPSIEEDPTAWESWNKEGVDLNKKYSSVVAKALQISLDRTSEHLGVKYVSDVVKSFLEEEQDKNKSAIEEVKATLVLASKYGFTNDKASRAIICRDPQQEQQRKLDGQLSQIWSVNQAPQGSQQVPTYIALTYEGTDANVNKKLTADDDAVFLAIGNLISRQKQAGYSGPFDFSAADIWREMNGITNTRKSPTKNQLQEICDRIDKMRFTHLWMDISKELEANYITFDSDRIKNGIADENYILASKRKVTTVKNRQIDAYRFYDMPFLYEYNIAKGHVILVDYRLLDTSDTTGNEGYTIVFRNYLLREIALMYNRSRTSNKILYSTVYKSTRVPTPEERIDRRKYSTDESYTAAVNRAASKDRKKISSLLESWKNKKWILGYMPTKEGRTYTGVTIELNSKNFTQKTIEAKTKKG